MIEIIISENDSGQRLNKFLMKYLNSAPSSFVYKMLRKKNIVLNDTRAKGDELLLSGDSVKLYLSDVTIGKFRKAGENASSGQEADKKADKQGSKLQLRILYQNDSVMAVHKPAGILSQKAGREDYSINECIVDYCRAHNIPSGEALLNFTPSVCNRLDRNTSGIILAGISLRGSQMLTELFRNRSADKYYFTIVQGNFKERRRKRAYIRKDADTNRVTLLDGETEGYTGIETEFIPLSCKNGYTFLMVKLITGKTHQIRAHLKQLGYPILGDAKYGNAQCNKMIKERFNLKHQLLHAGLIILPAIGADGDRLVIKDPLPEQFRKICEGLSLDKDGEAWRRGIQEACAAPHWRS